MRTEKITERELQNYFDLKSGLAILKRETDRGKEFHKAIKLIEQTIDRMKEQSQ
jgi:hypothetical protein